MKNKTAKIEDVRKALELLEHMIAEDPSLEGLLGKKLASAVDELTPKSTVSSVFKRLQGNALRDFALSKENGKVGYADDTKNQKVQEYVHSRFKSYMEDPKTSREAIALYNATYPSASSMSEVPNDDAFAA